MASGFATLEGEVQFFGDDFNLPPLMGGLGSKYLITLEVNGKHTHLLDAIKGKAETNWSVREKGIDVAIELTKRGIVFQDIIAICSKTNDKTPVVLGALLVGAIVAPLNPDWNTSILKNLIQKLKPKMIFCDMRILGYIEQALKESHDFTTQFILFSDSDPRSFRKIFYQHKDKHSTFKPIDIADSKTTVAFIVCTQGTTSYPKLVCISHHAIYVQTYYMRTYLMPNTQRVATFSTLSDTLQVFICCLCFEHCITKVIAESFTERNFCKTIQDSNVDTIWLGEYNAHKLTLYDSYQDYNLRHFHTMFLFGSSVSAAKMTKMRKFFSALTVINCYVITEMAFLVAAHHLNLYSIALRKPNSCGILMEGFRCKVVDIETGKTVGSNKWGELLLKGPSMMIGYHKDMEATKMSYENNWLKTDDCGQFDDDANLYVSGRISDLLLIKGKRVPPMEIEEIIETHPDVEEAAVIGLKDFLLACIVKLHDSSLTESILMGYIKEKLPEHKRPHHLKFVQSLPRTHTGSVRRNELRELYLHIRIERVESVQESKSFVMNKS